MQQKFIALFLVGALVLTAGCSGLGGNSTATPDPDQTTTPTVTEASAEDLPPGVNKSGIQDASVLAKTHFKQLNNTAYRSQLTMNDNFASLTGSSSQSDPEMSSLKMTAVNEPGADQQSLLIKGTNTKGETETVGVWMNGKYVTMQQQKVDATNAKYTRLRGGMGGAMLGQYGKIMSSSYLNMTLTRFDYNVSGVTSLNGDKVVKLTAAKEVTENGTTSTANAELYVTPKGVIKKSTLTMEKADKSAEASYTVSKVGSADATQPKWVSNVPAVTGSFTEDGKVLKLKHTGGKTIPDGTNVSVQKGITATGMKKLPEMQKGDAVYVYFTQQDGETAMHLSKTKPSSTSDLVTLDDGSVMVSSQLTNVRIQLTFMNQKASSSQ